MPMWQDSQRSTMLAAATLICTILRVPVGGLVLQAAKRVRGQRHQMLFDPGVARLLGLVDGLEQLAEFTAELALFFFSSL